MSDVKCVGPFRVAPPLRVHKGAERDNPETFAPCILDQPADQRDTCTCSAKSVRHAGVIRDDRLSRQNRIRQVSFVPV